MSAWLVQSENPVRCNEVKNWMRLQSSWIKNSIQIAIKNEAATWTADCRKSHDCRETINKQTQSIYWDNKSKRLNATMHIRFQIQKKQLNEKKNPNRYVFVLKNLYYLRVTNIVFWWIYYSENMYFIRFRMNGSRRTLQLRVLLISVVHIMLMVFLQFKLLAIFYHEVVYHNGNIPIGFYLLINGPFVLYYGICGLCALGAYHRNRQMLKFFFICQICVVGILFTIGTISAYIIFDGTRKNSVIRYNYTVTEINFTNKIYKISAIDVVCVGSFVGFILELYWLVITTKVYNEIRRLSVSNDDVPKYYKCTTIKPFLDSTYW